MCQVEKSDHTLTRGQLQSTEIPEEKWQQVSIDFITDLPETSSGVDSIMTVIDKATRMAHVIPCSKTATAVETARLYWRYVANYMESLDVYIWIEEHGLLVGCGESYGK